MKIIFTFVLIFIQAIAHADDLPIVFNKNISVENQTILRKVFNDASVLMPEKFKSSLPLNIEINLNSFNKVETVPQDICESKSFIYGQYDKKTNSLKLETSLLNEIKKGRNESSKILCQHKNLYDQVIATIIHELSHAYDFNYSNISKTSEFISVSDFKHSIFGIKSKNKNPMRSEDLYEFENINEFFAVNMEYFLMDSEYACRKPSLFNYYKKLFEIDPFPNRSCEINHTVMLTSAAGNFLIDLDPARVYRIDYLMASPGKDLSSGFGHAMFRVVMCAPDRVDPVSNIALKATPFGPKCLEDKLYHLVLSYRANVEDVSLSYLKGILGKYPSMLFVLNFGDVLDGYNKDELRDVVSYPLKLSENEKTDFIMRVLEEHWNYRGAYKFFTNNCAVESFDLLNRVLDLNQKSSLTPKGVLNDFVKLNLINMNDLKIEKYNAKLDQLLNSFKLAYNETDNLNKKGLQYFIDTSDVLVRRSSFERFRSQKPTDGNLNLIVTELRERVIRSSSFSFLEQQILRTKITDLKKKLTKLIMNSQDERIRSYFDQKTAELKHQVENNTNSGYGIPLKRDLENNGIEIQRNDIPSSSNDEIDKILKSLAPNEYLELDLISKNIKNFSEFTLELRKNYKIKLDLYIVQVLNNMARSSDMRSILILASQNDHDSLIKIRSLIGAELASEQELVDIRLIKMIESVVSNN